MPFSKQQVVLAAIALALSILTSHLAAGAQDETIVPLKTEEFMIKVPCWGKNSICIPICLAKGYTGGFCDVATCMCTKQVPDEAEAGVPSSQQLPLEPPLGKRGIGMLN